MAKKRFTHSVAHMNLCEYCIQAIQSHGERVVCLERETPFNDFELLVCDFCKDECEELTLCEIQ